MKRFSIFLSAFLLVLLSANYSFAEEAAPVSKTHFRIGLGLGIPYGVLGANLEVSPIDYLSLSVGAGTTILAGSATSVGARVYFVGKDKRFRPRISYFSGVVAIVQTTTTTYSNWGYSSSETEYESLTGSAAGVGFEWKPRRGHGLDFDLLFINITDDIPTGAEKTGPPVGISIGYGFYF